MDFEKLIDYLNTERSTHFKMVEPRGNYLAEFIESSTNISICFNRHYPLNLPDIYVNPSNGIRAHIDSEGKICLFDYNSVLVDVRQPEQLLIECYDKALEILDLSSDALKEYTEVLREADSYWMHLAGAWNISSALNTRKINYAQFEISSYSAKNNEKVQRFYLHNTMEDTCALEEKLRISQDTQHYVNTCTVIRLKKGTKFIELKSRYGWNELRQYIISNVATNIRRKFQKYTNEERKVIVEVIILILPSEFGDISFGFLLMGKTNRWVPMRNMFGITCRPLYVRRMDYEYLTNRAGALNMLEKKSILLLGCGSVGSFIASNLCKMGIKNLDILDKDDFYEENLYRHYLGINALANKHSRNKADLMKFQLESEYLDIDIDSLSFKDRSVEAFIEKPERLMGYDLIISALGEPTLNLRLNEILHEKKIEIPFICAFNEPYGIGGHTILTNLGDNGCLQCLYTDIMSDELQSYVASLVEPNQSFKKNISGCGSAFVPYNVLDSEETAINTARLAIAVLNGKEKENLIVTWFGNDETLISEGFVESDFYKNNRDKVRRRTVIQKNCNCKICSREND